MTYFQTRGRKYNNTPQLYNGLRYDSKKEATKAYELDLMLKAKEIKNWERQKTIELRVNDYLICKYRIDFVIEHNDGTLEYLEIKGFATDLWRFKWKLFEALYSDKKGIKLTVEY